MTLSSHSSSSSKRRRFLAIPRGAEVHWLDLIRPSLRRINQAIVSLPNIIHHEEMNAAVLQLLSFPDLFESHLGGKDFRSGFRSNSSKTSRAAVHFLSICQSIKAGFPPSSSPSSSSRPVHLAASSPFSSDTSRIKSAVKRVKLTSAWGNTNGVLRRAARLLTTTSSIPPVDTDTITKLRHLHPSAPSPSHPFYIPPNAPFINNIDRALLSTVIRKHCTGATPGPSGLTMEHLLPIIDSDDTDCFNGLCSLILCILNGVLSIPLRTVLTKSSLLPFSKPQGGIRPIAMGETLLKLASSSLLSWWCPVRSTSCSMCPRTHP